MPPYNASTCVQCLVNRVTEHLLYQDFKFPVTGVYQALGQGACSTKPPG